MVAMTAPVVMVGWTLSTVPMVGRVAVPTIYQSSGRDAVALHHHRVAEFLVELRQRGRPEHDLVRPVDRVTREDRGRDGGMGGLAQNGHDVIVDLHRGEIGTGRRRHGVVMGQRWRHQSTSEPGRSHRSSSRRRSKFHP